MTQARRRHILVVDGAAEVRSIVREILEEAGYRVSVSAEALPDLDDVKRTEADLIILDPVASAGDLGWELLRRVQQDRDTADIPVVVCTGHPRVVRQLAGHLDERDIALVPKPFDIEELLGVVEARLDSSPGAR